MFGSSVDSGYVKLVDRYLEWCLNGTHPSRHSFHQLSYDGDYLLVGSKRVVRFVPGKAFLFQVGFRGFSFLRPRIISFAEENGIAFFEVPDIEDPEGDRNVNYMVASARRLLDAPFGDVWNKLREIELAERYIESLHQYCRLFGVDCPDSDSWLLAKHRGLIRLRPKLETFLGSIDYMGPAPPPVMGQYQYENWVRERLAFIDNPILRRAAEWHRERRVVIYIRYGMSSNGMRRPLIRLFRHVDDRYVPYESLGVWFGNLVRRYGYESAPDVAVGLLERFGVPFVPAGSENLIVDIRMEFRGVGQNLVFPYVEFVCPCCSDAHEYRPSNRLDVQQLMNVHVGAVCPYAYKDLVLLVANYTEREVEDILVECSLRSQ